MASTFSVWDLAAYANLTWPTYGNLTSELNGTVPYLISTYYEYAEVKTNQYLTRALVAIAIAVFLFAVVQLIVTRVAGAILYIPLVVLKYVGDRLAQFAKSVWGRCVGAVSAVFTPAFIRRAVQVGLMAFIAQFSWSLAPKVRRDWPEIAEKGSAMYDVVAAYCSNVTLSSLLNTTDST